LLQNTPADGYMLWENPGDIGSFFDWAGRKMRFASVVRFVYFAGTDPAVTAGRPVI
jgi:hypothetical protein